MVLSTYVGKHTLLTEPGHEHFVERNRELFEGKRVLDLGCGLPQERSAIESVATTYIGFDYALGTQPTVQGTSRSLPFNPQSIDTIFAGSHLPMRFFNLIPGNITHWLDLLKSKGTVVLARRYHQPHKDAWEATARKYLTIVDEQETNYAIQGARVPVRFTRRYLVGTPNRCPRAARG